MNPSLDGLLVLDKPAGLTSRAALDRAARWFPRGTRVGHTGTLDPLATGVLVLCLGSATRLAEYVQRMRKTYRSVFRLGARSDTDDADGTITPVAGATPPDLAAVQAGLTAFVGAIAQTPPAHSAAKVAGQRAYDLARRGQEVDLQPRTVQVYRIEILRYAYPELEVEVDCGKGTYIRSLARDLGEQLGCGGLVQVLRRTRVGPFRAEEAVPLDADPERGRAALLPSELAVSDLPRVQLAAGELRRLGQGQALPMTALPAGDEEEAAVFDADGRLAAIAVCDVKRRLLRPAKVWRG
jgi:tRNA pseudouridine55 synthase